MGEITNPAHLFSNVRRDVQGMHVGVRLQNASAVASTRRCEQRWMSITQVINTEGIVNNISINISCMSINISNNINKDITRSINNISQRRCLRRLLSNVLRVRVVQRQRSRCGRTRGKE